MRAREFILEVTDPVAGDVGPHEGQELALMQQGNKPAALISKSQYTPEWANAVKQNGWTTMNVGQHSVVISKTPQIGAQIQKLVQNMQQTGQNTPQYHQALGKLLGYSPADIAKFSSMLGGKPTVPGGQEAWRQTARYMRDANGNIVPNPQARVKAPVAATPPAKPAAPQAGPGSTVKSNVATVQQGNQPTQNFNNLMTPPVPSNPKIAADNLRLNQNLANQNAELSKRLAAQGDNSDYASNVAATQARFNQQVANAQDLYNKSIAVSS